MSFVDRSQRVLARLSCIVRAHLPVRFAAVLLVIPLAAGHAGVIAPDRHVDAAIGTDSGDCSLQASPCATIAYAIVQANPGDTIHIAAGTYVEPLLVTLDGLRLVGNDPADKPLITRTSGATNQPLLVIDGARDVRVENLDFGLDQSFVAEGILASGFVDGLAIVGNHFGVSRSTAASSTFGYRNAVSINDVRNSRNLPRVNGSTVLVDANVIDGVNPAQNAFLRSGVDMDAGLGTISGNIIAAGTHDVVVRFATVTPASTSDSITIDGNTLGGRGLEFASPNAGVSQVGISANAISALVGIDGIANTYPADWSLVRLIHNPSAVPVSLAGNQFSGHQGSYRGVLVENFPGLSLNGNVFTPAAGVTDFVSLVLSNKEITSDNPPSPPYAMTLVAVRNTFNGSGVAGAGRAVQFLDDNDAGGSATFGAIGFGDADAANANVFDDDLRWYFHLDDHDCNTVSAPTCAFLDYAGVGTIPDTEVRPFRGNVSARNNLFAGVLPANMNAGQRAGLSARTHDADANAALGTVDYGLAASETQVYVDDGFAGSAYGDEKTFVHGVAGTFTVYFGINAFATIAEGLLHLTDGGALYAAKGVYDDSLVLDRQVYLIGDGNGPLDTVIGAGVTITAGGPDNTHRQVLQNLRIANGATDGDGVTVVGSVSNLAFDTVAFAGNGRNGLRFPGNAQVGNLHIQSSSFEGNGQFGILVSTTAVVQDVWITASQFTANAAGIVLFGGDNVGTGQIRNWFLALDTFSGNDSADATIWGGGIWIKTGGAGSVIDGFTVNDSTFADNGSSNPLNRTGITLRARPDTILRNVSLCGNTFSETAAPGTQLTGINVFDDTGNSGYAPITVCASNSFNGLAHSISGLEQHTLHGTQPVVDITGGSIPGTEYINGLVTRVRDGATFASIGAAMNDAGTTVGDEIHAPAGVYRENVVVTHDDMILGGDGAATLIDGTGLPGSGVRLPNGRTGTTLRDLAVRNFTAIGSTGGACIDGDLANSGTTISGTTVSGCAGGRGGIFLSGGGGIDDVTIENNDISDSDGRGIVIWGGFKTHIAINDNHVHDMSGCCGIELQDGSASGVSVTGNVIENVADSGMAFIGLGAGAGANLVADNQITNSGRFGIEIKLPNGSGGDNGDGSIVVENNTVTRPANPTSTDLRDVAGIAVIRRSYCPTCSETDVTTGVVVRNNTVTGWVPLAGSPHDGFGVVVEGSGMHVHGNALTGNQIGIQLQAGNGGYPGDADQAAVSDFFSRGNAPVSCVDLGPNTFSGNVIDNRNVTDPPGQPIVARVHNSARGTAFCAIQAAIDDAATLAGDTLAVDPGSYAENVSVTKGVTLSGPKVGIAGYDPARDGSGEAVISPPTGIALRVLANDVVFDGFTIADVDDTAIASGGNYGGVSGHVAIANNRVLDVHAGSGLYTNGPADTPVTDWNVSGNLIRNIGSPIGSGINLWAVSGGTIASNQVQQAGFGGIQVKGGNGVQVHDNAITQTAHNGINIALSQDVDVYANTVVDANTSGSPDEAGLTLYGGSSDVAFYCNTVGGSGSNGFSTAAAIADPFSDIRVFHNAIDSGSDISHNLAQGIAIGSNWYGGSAPDINGGNAAGVQVATALAATPIGNPACGDNAAVAGVLAVSGTPQSAEVNTPFASALVARAVDALGGSVVGVPVAFSAPASGASASLGSAADTDYDGRSSVVATANDIAGSYLVSASVGGASADFALTNTGEASVVLSLDGPQTGLVAGTPQAGYIMQLANTGAALPENVLLNFAIARTTGGFNAASDVTLEYDSGGGYTAIALALCNTDQLCGSFGPPGVGFPVGGGYNVVTALRFGSIRSGTIGIAASVVGVGSQTAYATASLGVDVDAAAAATIAASGATGFSGTAGEPLVAPLPTVIVTDAFGNPVQGAVVGFGNLGGGGSISGATPTTAADGTAALGSWTLGPVAGINTVDASLAGVTGSPVTFTADAVAAADLAIAITDEREYARYGQLLTYIISVTNGGASDATAVTVSDVLPAELDAASANWICIAAGGASCTPDGNGDIADDAVAIPVGGSVTYLLTATVNDDAGMLTDIVANMASVSVAGDPQTANNQATDSTRLVIFRDGFEAGGDGAQWLPGTQPAELGELSTGHSLMLDLAPLWATRAERVILAQGHDGDTTFRVEAIVLAGQAKVRLAVGDARGERASAWSALDATAREIGLGLLATDEGERRLLLVGGAPEIELGLGSGRAFRVSAPAGVDD